MARLPSLKAEGFYYRNCVSCGAPFSTPYYSTWTDSMPCRIAWERKKMKVYNHKRYLLKKKATQSIIDQECVVCGKHFKTNLMEREVLCFGCKLAGKTVADRNMTKDYGVYID
jgi:DNA helicase IV